MSHGIGAGGRGRGGTANIDSRTEMVREMVTKTFGHVQRRSQRNTSSYTIHVPRVLAVWFELI